MHYDDRHNPGALCRTGCSVYASVPEATTIFMRLREQGEERVEAVRMLPP
jgi:hypothetical protein